MMDFKLAQPKTIEQTTAFLGLNQGKAAVMAGGTDLLDEIKNQTLQPDIVVDLNSIPNLDAIQQENASLKIGALTRIVDLAENETIKENFPGLVEAALSLASPQLRNMGTVGGNLCQRPRCWYYRDPQVNCRKKGGSRCFAMSGKNKYHAIFGGGMCYIVFPSDLAPVLISLNARAVIATGVGEKTVPLADFYTLPRQNVRTENILGADEFLKEIILPMPAGEVKSTYLKLKERGTWDFAIVSVAVSGEVSNGAFQGIRIVCGGVAPIPWRLTKAERFIEGKLASEGMLRQAVQEELNEARPLSDNGYKLDLLEVAVYRAAMSLSGLA
jgi:xanthine dehydrogenase YagS FAD-binding subunit